MRLVPQRFLGVMMAIMGTALLTGCGGGDDKSPAAATVPATTTTAAEATTTTLPRIGAVQRTQGGNTITVHAVEAPTTPDNRQFLEPDAGMQKTAIDVEVCVMPDSEASGWTESMFEMETPDHRRWTFWNVQEYARSPRFGFDDVPPGQCDRGWITFQTPAGQPITSVRWIDPTSPGNTLSWAV